MLASRRIAAGVLVAMTCTLMACGEAVPTRFVRWVPYGPIPPAVGVLDPAVLQGMQSPPDRLVVNGIGYAARPEIVSAPRIDLGQLFYPGDTVEAGGYDPARSGNRAYLMTSLYCEEASELMVGAGADWWMRWYVDGKPVFDTLDSGNGSHAFSVFDHAFKLKLDKGNHLVCVEVRSGSGGWTFAATADPHHRTRLETILCDQEAAASRQAAAMEALSERAQSASRMKLAIFGSSVALGAGATEMFGWANQLGAVLENGNWDVVNVSAGGDRTEKLMARFEDDLLSVNPDMVILGLSLANEGITGHSPAVYAQYVRNMRKLIQMCRKHEIIPIVANGYPNNSYNAEHYAYIRAFNAELNRWPVASIDLLGTVDDGQGRWQADCWRDGGHPNDRGHTEMFHAIPPSLFDHLIDPTYPLPTPVNVWLATTTEAPEDRALLVYRPEYPIRSFSYCFTMKFQGALSAGAVLAAVNDCTVGIDDRGTFTCTLPDGGIIRSGVKPDLAQSHVLGMTYSACKRVVRFYVDGVDVGSADGEIDPDTFFLGGGKTRGGPQALYKDCLLYRSCLDADSMAALASGTWLRSSLQLLAPLDDYVLHRGIPLGNRAQTAAHMILGSSACRRVVQP